MVTWVTQEMLYNVDDDLFDFYHNCYMISFYNI